MKLTTLSPSKKIDGRRVLVRVDWNIPLKGSLTGESLLKIERSLATLRNFSRRGAKVIVLTHLGRPEGRDKTFSTQRLLPTLRRRFGVKIRMHTEVVSDQKARLQLKKKIDTAPNGSWHLLENVRFEEGEEKNDKKLAKAYAELGDIFINDAFASCHRAHVSVVGLTRVLPSYAGPALVAEVRALTRLVEKPSRPFVAVIGGKKLSTKIPVLQALRRHCDRILIGGAMATTFFAARGQSMGKSFVDTTALAVAKRLSRDRRFIFSEDAIVTDRVERGASSRVRKMNALQAKDIVVDIGPETLKTWSRILVSAKTILWNGPEGVDELPPWDYGSRMIAKIIGRQAALHSVFGVAGGGDTIPVVVMTRTMKKFDYISTGGGALLEFIAKEGRLPGLVPLIEK